MNSNFINTFSEYRKKRKIYKTNRLNNSTIISLLVIFFILLFIAIKTKSTILLSFTIIVFITYLFYDYKLRKDYGL